MAPRFQMGDLFQNGALRGDHLYDVFAFGRFTLDIQHQRGVLFGRFDRKFGSQRIVALAVGVLEYAGRDKQPVFLIGFPRGRESPFPEFQGILPESQPDRRRLVAFPEFQQRHGRAVDSRQRIIEFENDVFLRIERRSARYADFERIGFRKVVLFFLFLLFFFFLGYDKTLHSLQQP